MGYSAPSNHGRAGETEGLTLQPVATTYQATITVGLRHVISITSNPWVALGGGRSHPACRGAETEAPRWWGTCPRPPAWQERLRPPTWSGWESVLFLPNKCFLVRGAPRKGDRPGWGAWSQEWWILPQGCLGTPSLQVQELTPGAQVHTFQHAAP